MKSKAAIRGIVATVALASTTLAAQHFPTIAHAATFTKVTRVTMEDASAYSIGLAMSTWPKGAQKVFVAAATDTISIGVTIPAAKSQNAPLLLVDPAAPDQVLAAIGKLGAQDAVLVGPGFSPKNALRQQINAITTTQQWIGGAGPLEVDVPLSSMFAAPTEEAVVTDARSTADLVTSSSAAALEGAPLLTVGPSLDTWEESELARLKPKRVVFVGDAVATSAALSKLESLGYPTFSVEGADPVTRNQKVADLLRGRNLDTRRFHVSVPQAAAAAVPAAYKAALEGSIVRFAGSGTSLTGELADEAAAWGIESTNGTVIGTAAAVADSFLADLEKAMTKPRAPKPDFQALGSSTSGGVHTLEMSTQPGAALYRLFDLSGTRVSEASAPVFVLPDGQSTFSAKAYSATGALLAERDVRVVIADEEKSTANVASVITSDGQASVVNWKQHADDTRPRTVIRSEIVRATDGTLAVQGQTLIGMTCGTEYVDSSRPAGREVAYEVSQDGTDVGNICTSTEPNHSELREEITLTSARVPAIQSTAPAKASLLGSLSMASTSPSTSPDAPTPTLVEQAFMDSRQQAASPSAGSGMTPMTAQSASPLPWTFRYQTFIADQYVRPADWDTQVFDGNNRGFGAWIDRYKTRADITYNFDANWRVQSTSFSKSVGTTTEYSCPVGSFSRCTYLRQGRASDSGIYMTGAAIRNVHVAHIHHEAALPFRPHGYGWGLVDAPGISYEVDYKYGAYGFTISGIHDGAPSHEIWGGYVPGEYYPFLKDNRRCDFGFGLAGLCMVWFNVKV